MPSFGWLESFDDGNQHGALPNGLLVATSGTNWYGYDPDTGVLTRMNITNVPTGTSVQGPKGSILRLCLVNYGTTAAPNWYLQEWNSTKLISTPGGIGQSGWYTSTINASNPTANKPLYDYNKSITLMNGASWSINGYSNYNGVMLFPKAVTAVDQTLTTAETRTAQTSQPSAQNQKTGDKSYGQSTSQRHQATSHEILSVLDQENGVFIFEDRESLTHTGYNLLTGEKLWGPTEPADQYDYFRSTTRVAYGNFYFGGYGGIVYCYDTLTGNLKWTYGNGGEGNSTASGLDNRMGTLPNILPSNRRRQSLPSNNRTLP